MADNFVANAGSGGSTFASDDVGGIQYPRVKISHGGNGVAADHAVGVKRISTASTNAVNVKATAGVVYSIVALNLNAAVRFLKLYASGSTPVVGTDTPAITLPIPASTTGAGLVIAFNAGIEFANGIGFAFTTGAADSDTGAVAANEIFLHLGYV